MTLFMGHYSPSHAINVNFARDRISQKGKLCGYWHRKRTCVNWYLDEWKHNAEKIVSGKRLQAQNWETVADLLKKFKIDLKIKKKMKFTSKDFIFINSVYSLMKNEKLFFIDFFIIMELWLIKVLAHLLISLIFIDESAE